MEAVLCRDRRLLARADGVEEVLQRVVVGLIEVRRLEELRLLAPQLAPLLTEFQRQNPELVVRYLIGDRLFRLEYGEAHVAIRAGAAPDQPDNVVQPYAQLAVGAYASRDYVAQYGIPQGPEDYHKHRFIAADNRDSRAPYHKWLWATVPEESVTWRSTSGTAMEAALRAGAGIGGLPAAMGRNDPQLVEIHAPRPDWGSALWLVTHVDLHRTSKVQAVLRFLKEHAEDAVTCPE